MVVPTQIIPRHLVEHHDAYRQIIDEHFAAVSQKARNQMRTALKRPLNGFWTEFLWPNLLLDQDGQRREQIEVAVTSTFPLEQRPIYLPISNTVYTPGHNHELAVMASESDPDEVQDQMSVFANPLRIGCQAEDGQWEAPMLRAVGTPFTIFTLEYDPPSEWDRERRLKFLDTQLGWFRNPGTNDLDRPIRPVWEWAAQFSDFRGICANWSGHKSVHIHLIFDTSTVMTEFPELRDQVRTAYTRLWSEMAAEIARVFTQDIDPDPALRLPEQYRKLPNGVFTVEPPKGQSGHLLRIPAGTRVPLLCVWEKLLTRAPKGAARAFVNEAVLKQSAATGSRRIGLHRRQSQIGDMTPDEHQFCSERFDELIKSRVGPNQFPKGAGLHRESSGWIGRLYANEFDKNPSTLIFEDGHRMTSSMVW